MQVVPAQYPPQQYPPQQYPPQQYPPQQYPPQQYPPQQYPPQQYPPQQYPPQQYPPQQYPPQQQFIQGSVQVVQMVPMVPVMAQPAIDRYDLNNHNDLLVKQTRKGCCQELMGCEANTEFKIATKAASKDDIFYALEDTSCCLRFFCPNLRPFTINVTKGAGPGGEAVSRYHRPFACPVGSCKLCCRQSIILEKNAARNGKIIEGCYCCVPTFKVLKEDGTHQFNIHQPTCCGGMCVDCCAEGCCNCRIPFYIFVPGASGEVGSQSGKIVKVSLFFYIQFFIYSIY